MSLLLLSIWVVSLLAFIFREAIYIGLLVFLLKVCEWFLSGKEPENPRHLRYVKGGKD